MKPLTRLRPLQIFSQKMGRSEGATWDAAKAELGGGASGNSIDLRDSS